MSIRLLAGLAACALVAGPALANDKKKSPPTTPETGPAPVLVPAAWSPPPVMPTLPPPAPRVIELPLHAVPGIATPLPPVLPSPRYLDNPPPDYFKAVPQFPFPRELAYQEEAAGLVNVQDRATVVKTYSVGDLVVPLPKAGQNPAHLPKTLEAQLIKSITGAVHPKSWKSAGGNGTIDYYPIGMALIINAVPEVHTALAKYLDGVRQMNDLQIAIDVLVVRVSTEGLERCGWAKDFLPSKDRPNEIRTRTKFLTAEDVADFRLCKDEQTQMTRPSLTILNGQEGCVEVRQVEYFLTGVTVQSMNNAIVMVPKNEPHDTGVEVKIEGTVSADKRFVRLAVHGKLREVAARPVALVPVTVPITGIAQDGKPAEKVPFTQFIEDPKFVTRGVNEVVNVPDGGTVVFYGGKADIERKIREKLPMLADVPVLAELFCKDRTEATSDHLLVFATPRVVNPSAGTEECEAPCCAKDGRLGKLLAEYDQACKAGKSAEALKLAVECLSLDPTCFAKK